MDGYTYKFDEVIAKDEIKERKLNKLGIHVLRFNDEEVMKDIENVIRVIEQYMDEFELGHPPVPLIRGGIIRVANLSKVGNPNYCKLHKPFESTTAIARQPLQVILTE